MHKSKNPSFKENAKSCGTPLSKNFCRPVVSTKQKPFLLMVHTATTAALCVLMVKRHFLLIAGNHRRHWHVSLCRVDGGKLLCVCAVLCKLISHSIGLVSLQVTFAHFHSLRLAFSIVVFTLLATQCFRSTRERQNRQLPPAPESIQRERQRNLISCDTQRIFLSAWKSSTRARAQRVYFLAA